MKKSLLLTLLAALLFAVGFILYFQYFSRHNADLWDYVPANTVAVYETNDPVGNWNSFVGTSIWNSLEAVEGFDAINRSFTIFDSLLGSNGTLDKVLRGRRMLVSTHMISRQNYDHLFYFDLPANSTEALQLANIFALEMGTSERLYEGVIITEIGKGEDRFSYIVYDRIFIGGFTPYLVEDVIRNEQDRFQQGFKTEHAEAFRVPAIEGDLGNLYINHKEFENQLSAVIGNSAGVSKLIGAMADATFLDVEANDDHLLLNGFSVGATSDTFLLHGIDEQRAGDFRIKQLIPEATAFLLQYSFSNLELWQNQQSQFWKLHAISSSVESSAKEVISHISDEVALATLESINVDRPDRVLFLRTDNSSALLDWFDQRSAEINLQKGDTMYFEYYYDHRIARLNLHEFPASFLGPSFEGFDQSFYLTFQNYLVVGNNMRAITRFLDDIENDNTWGKRMRVNNFLENVVVESNISLIINTPRAWSMIESRLQPAWASRLEPHSALIKSFDLVALQFADADKKHYASIAFHHRAGAVVTPTVTAELTLDSLFTTPIIAGVMSSPKVVRNHTNGSLETLVQDSTFALNLVSSRGELHWSTPIHTAVTTKIHQIDYLKNGKLQYLMGTADSTLLLIDRNGNYVEGFPRNLGHKAKQLFVLDYDMSKNYRFLIDDGAGNLWMYNREGKNLEGWNPRKYDRGGILDAYHLRIRGRDCIFVSQQHGVVNVTNRRGEPMPGFPIDLKTPLTNPVNLTKGADFASTVFTSVTDQGEVVRFNLSGIVDEPEQLYRPSKDTKFSLVQERQGKTFVYLRNDPEKMTILDSRGNVVFENEFLAGQELLVQFYDFGTGHEIFAITDIKVEKTFIFNQAGKLLNYPPIPNRHPVSMVYYESRNRLEIYSADSNSVSLSGITIQ